jgi:rhodanese-related sulfurtransferase
MQQITVTQLAALANPVVIDVREPDEYAGGHAPGAVNIPLGQLEDRLSEIPATEDVYVICQSGRRSALATDALVARGFSATNIDGGTSAWIQAGLPTVTPSR